jgi:hypothetical protein
VISTHPYHLDAVDMDAVPKCRSHILDGGSVPAPREPEHRVCVVGVIDFGLHLREKHLGELLRLTPLAL